jgi:hypothetical protein
MHADTNNNMALESYPYVLVAPLVAYFLVSCGYRIKGTSRLSLADTFVPNSNRGWFTSELFCRPCYDANSNKCFVYSLTLFTHKVHTGNRPFELTSNQVRPMPSTRHSADFQTSSLCRPQHKNSAAPYPSPS